MENSISDLELEILKEMISIADEFASEGHQNKIALNDYVKEKYKGDDLKKKYKNVIPEVKYTTCPQKDGHLRSAIELTYVIPEETITICFLDGKHYWSSIPKEFTDRINKKIYPEEQ
jgi:hypothetical protein